VDGSKCPLVFYTNFVSTYCMVYGSCSCHFCNRPLNASYEVKVGCSSLFLKPLVYPPLRWCIYHRVGETGPVRHQTYGYLSGHRLLPLPFGHSAEDRRLSGFEWLVAYQDGIAVMVTRLSTDQA